MLHVTKYSSISIDAVNVPELVPTMSEMKTKTEPIVTQMVSTNAAELDASVHLSTVTVAAGSVGEILTGIFLIVIVIITTLVIGQQAEVVAIAVGSAGGGLILLITLAVVITMILCYKHKQESYRLTTNVAYTTEINTVTIDNVEFDICLLYTSPSPRDATLSRMPSSA